MCVCVCVSDLSLHRNILSGPLQASLSHSPAFPKNCSKLPYKAKRRLLISLVKVIGSGKTTGAERPASGSHFHSDSAKVFLENRLPRRCSFFSSLSVIGCGEVACCSWCLFNMLVRSTHSLGLIDNMPWSLETLQEAPIGDSGGTKRCYGQIHSRCREDVR